MSQDKQLAKLVYEWTSGEERFRLVMQSQWTPGHEDSYVVERAGKDALGAVKWEVFQLWTCAMPQPFEKTLTELARAINKLVADLAAAKGERRG